MTASPPIDQLMPAGPLAARMFIDYGTAQWSSLMGTTFTIKRGLRSDPGLIGGFFEHHAEEIGEKLKIVAPGEVGKLQRDVGHITAQLAFSDGQVRPSTAPAGSRVDRII
jgi:hypothetical protein